MGVAKASKPEGRPRSKVSAKKIHDFFGQNQSGDNEADTAAIEQNENAEIEDVICPMCNKDLGYLKELRSRVLHVEECLGAAAADEMVSEECAEMEPSMELAQSETTLVASERTEHSICNAVFSGGSEPAEHGALEIPTDVTETLTCNAVQVITNEQKETVQTSSTSSSSAASVSTGVKTRRSVPFYKVLQIGNQKIAVDAFSYGPIPGVRSFFLTHFHSDHYGGLSKSWKHGIIYCTPATSRLVQMYLQVDPEYLREIEINEWCVLDGIEILFLEANHCPGSVIILFSAPDYTIVHTGDFRACESQVLRLKQLLRHRPINALYLDTTYLDPSHSFPSQDDVIKTCGEYCYNFKQCGEAKSRMPTIERFFKPIASAAMQQSNSEYNPLVLVGTYTIGKERLAVHIAERLETKIFTQDRKRDTLAAIGDERLCSLLGSNGFECGVHLVNMRQLNWYSLDEYFKPLSKTFTHLLAFMPTGWTFKSDTKSSDDTVIPEFGQKELERCRKIRHKTHLFKVPYSEHSSFMELRYFCTSLPIVRVIPTVNTASENSRHKMNYYLEKWTKK